jgi:hypothetical protein
MCDSNTSPGGTYPELTTSAAGDVESGDDSTSSDPMQPLSFPCVVTRLEGEPPLASRRTWIQGRSLRELSIAAAHVLEAADDGCAFTIIEPEWPKGRVFLNVLRHAPTAEALVGPMAGPRPTGRLSETPRHSLDELIESLGVDNDPRCRMPASRTLHVVTVRHASVWTHVTEPLVQHENESKASYRSRCTAAEDQRIDRASGQGFYPIAYAVPAVDWTAYDFAQVIDLAYQRLPVTEPPARESGWISQRIAAHTRCCWVHVARGEYVASLRLPSFPTTALVEWLSHRRCAIDLYHPVRNPVYGDMKWHGVAGRSRASVFTRSLADPLQSAAEGGAE